MTRAAMDKTQQARRKRTWLSTALRSLMYVRVPLIDPDVFLERTVGLARHLVGRVAVTLYLSLAIIGVTLLLQRFDAYVSTFPHFFNVRGAICFALAVAVVKVIHEFSHAYVAKATGNRVPVMGVAFILLFPVAYSDVTDSWRMQSRRKRLLIALAGVIAELTVAGIALFIWALSTPGLVKSVCFVVSSVTLLSTLLVNLNPAMRFDGYYVLSDLLRIDNLQSRAFAVTRWALRRYVLGMDIEAPEVSLSRRRLGVMIAYSVLAWIYRLFLFSGIAWMVYARVTKALGALLFAAVIYTFVVRPIASELASLLRAVHRRGWNLRAALVGATFLLLLLWAAVPMRRWHGAPAVTVPRDSQVVYAPGDGILRKLDVALGEGVRAGQMLFEISSAELERAEQIAHLELRHIGLELAIIQGDEKKRALLPETREQRARAIAKLETIRAAIESNRVVAEVDGVVVEWDEGLRNGTPVGANQILGRIVDQRAPGVVCYLKHDVVSDIVLQSRVYFTSRARPGRLSGTVTNIDPLRTTFLAHDNLSSAAGGDIAVRPDARSRLEVIDTYYEVEVTLDHTPQTLRLGQTGTLWLRTAPRSRLADWASGLFRIAVRESTF